jgi:hypothetical protein
MMTIMTIITTITTTIIITNPLRARDAYSSVMCISSPSLRIVVT